MDKKKKPTDAKSDTGITIGLIDSMITAARVLRKMDDPKKATFFKNHPEIQEAIKDFYQDADVKHLFVMGIKYSKEKIVI
jgi:hypothetical protein